MNNNSSQSPDFIFSGFPNLDRALTAFKKGYLYVLAGAPSMGKTTFLVNLIHNMHAQCFSLKSIVFSLDLSSEFFINRLISCSSGVALEKINRNNLSYSDLDCIKRRCSYLKEFLSAINDTGDITLHQVINECEKAFVNKGLDIIFIDYIELLQNNSDEEFSAILKELQNFARTKNVCIICSSLASRESIDVNTGKFMPKLSNLNSNISRIADVIFILSKPDFYFDEILLKDILELNIAKNRIGDRENLRFKTSFNIQKITEYEEPDEQDFIGFAN